MGNVKFEEHFEEQQDNILVTIDNNVRMQLHAAYYP